MAEYKNVYSALFYDKQKEAKMNELHKQCIFHK